jgi:hypothetical protein
MGRFIDTPHGQAAMFLAWLGEEHVKRGVKNLNASRLGGRMRKEAAATATARVIEAMSALLETDPRRNVNRAATKVAKRSGMSLSAVRGAWYRHLRNKRVTIPPL